jgi:DNA-binding NtrC family response regulator
MTVTRRTSTDRMTVLVVEDEPRMREMLTRAIADFGYLVSAANSAEAALKALARGAAQIVLLDLNLPGMEGLELLRHIRTALPAVQVIILTGFGSLEAAQSAIRHDAVDFLTKPCPLHELDVALSRARLRIGGTPVTAPGGEAPSEDKPGAGTLDELERQHILAMLERHDGNRATTAAELGISERTLYYRLAQYAQQKRL